MKTVTLDPSPDNSTNAQKLNDALQYGPVNIPYGEWNINGYLNLNNSLCGNSSKLIFPKLTNAAVQMKFKSNLVVEDVHFKGANEVGLCQGPGRVDAWNGVSLWFCDNIRFLGVTISNFHTQGLNCYGTVNSSFDCGLVHDCGRDGMWFGGYYDTNQTRKLEGISIKNYDIENTGDDAIAFWAINKNVDTPKYIYGQDITLEDIRVRHRTKDDVNAMGRGIVLAGIRYSFLSDISISNTVSHGLMFTRPEVDDTLHCKCIDAERASFANIGKAVGYTTAKKIPAKEILVSSKSEKCYVNKENTNG